MRIFVLLLCLLFTLSCVKHAAPPPPVAAAPPVLPQFERLNALYEGFQEFREDPLFVRYGFTFNSPYAGWLQQVQRLELDPDLAEGARVLAGLAVAHRQHGAGSVVTRRYETRFASIVRALPEEPEGPAEKDVPVDTAGDVAPPEAVTETSITEAEKPASDVSATLDDVVASVVRTAVPPAESNASSVEPPAVAVDTPVAEAETPAPPVEAAASSTQDVVSVPDDMPAAPPFEEGFIPPAPPATEASAAVAAAPVAESAPAAPAAEEGIAQSAPPATEASTEVAAAPVAESAPAAPAAEEGIAQSAPPAIEASAPVAAASAAESAPAAPAAEEDIAQPAPPAAGASPAPPVVESAGSVGNAAVFGQVPAVEAGATASAIQSLPAQSPGGVGARAGVTILFSGDTQGVIFPQPGVAGPVGGLARRPPLLARIRAEVPGTVLVDAGDAFASGFGRAGRINNVLVRAMNRMGYDVMGLGPHDLAVGEVALRELVSVAEFPFVCSNLVFQGGVKPWIKPYAIIRRGPFRIGVISLLPPDAGAAVTGARLVPPVHALHGVLAELGPKVDGVVVLTQMGSAEVAGMLDGLPVAVVAGDGKAPSREIPLYLPAVPKGLGFGRVRLEAAEGGALRPVEHGPVLLGEQQDGQMLRLLEELRN